MTVDISELTSQINGNVLTPADGGYDESLHRWAENAERKAAVVVLVISSADVAVAVFYISILILTLLARICQEKWTRNCH